MASSVTYPPNCINGTPQPVSIEGLIREFISCYYLSLASQYRATAVMPFYARFMFGCNECTVETPGKIGAYVAKKFEEVSAINVLSVHLAFPPMSNGPCAYYRMLVRGDVVSARGARSFMSALIIQLGPGPAVIPLIVEELFTYMNQQ